MSSRNLDFRGCSEGTRRGTRLSMTYPRSTLRDTRCTTRPIHKLHQVLSNVTCIRLIRARVCCPGSSVSKSGAPYPYLDSGSSAATPSSHTDLRVTTWSSWREKSMKNSKRRRRLRGTCSVRDVRRSLMRKKRLIYSTMLFRQPVRTNVLKYDLEVNTISS